jgi:hypothetical protein
MIYMKFCQYQDIFGEPKEGIHSIRIFNIAIVDLLLTIVAALLISHYTQIRRLYSFVILIVVSIFFHKIFCVRTTVMSLLGLV